MGESRGGEGRAVGPTVISGAAALLGHLANEGFEVADLHVSRITSGLYQFEIGEHGMEDKEIGHISIPTDVPSDPALPPIGGSMDEREDF